MNASTRFEDLFNKMSQLQTQKANQFIGNKAAAFYDRPLVRTPHTPTTTPPHKGERMRSLKNGCNGGDGEFLLEIGGGGGGGGGGVASQE